MKSRQTAVERFSASSSANRRLLRREQLILEATEAVSAALAECDITRAELAARLGKSKGFVSQILSGSRNLTLRTLADVADALGCGVRISLGPVEPATRRRNRSRVNGAATPHE